jgi:spermidine/putrescine transport system permease protein
MSTVAGDTSPRRAPAWWGVGPPRQAGSQRVLPLVLGLPVAFWQALFFVGPLAFLVVITFWEVRSFRLEPAFVSDNWARILGASTFHKALAHTLLVSTLATVLAVLLALPAAYTIAFRLSPRARNLVVAALIAPVFSSYIVRIYAWQVVLSPQGIANSFVTALGLPALDLLGGAFSLQIGFLTLTLPIAVLIIMFAFSGIDGTLIEAAENLGCTRARVFWHVVLPAARPALVLAASTSFLLAFGDFVSPMFMTGSRPPTLSILIVDTVKSGSQWPRASVIGVAMLLVLMVVVGLGRWLGAPRRAKLPS